MNGMNNSKAGSGGIRGCFSNQKEDPPGNRQIL